MTGSPAELLASLQWRYATKAFDCTRAIDPGTWQALESSLVLTPSSYGLQPWRFLVLPDPELRGRLRPHAWNQAQIPDCSQPLPLNPSYAPEQKRGLKFGSPGMF